METEVDLFFSFKASFRVKKAPQLHSEITLLLGEPTECHVHGDPVPEVPGKCWKNALWMLRAKVEEKEDINVHLAWIKNVIAPHRVAILRWIEEGADIDIYMSYDCSQEHRGFSVYPENLSIFSELGIKFEVSIMR